MLFKGYLLSFCWSSTCALQICLTLTNRVSLTFSEQQKLHYPTRTSISRKCCYYVRYYVTRNRKVLMYTINFVKISIINVVNLLCPCTSFDGNCRSIFKTLIKHRILSYFNLSLTNLHGTQIHTIFFCRFNAYLLFTS